MTFKDFLEYLDSENIYISKSKYADIPDDAIVTILPGYFVGDGVCCLHYPEAEDHEEAADEFVETGDWGEEWTRVHMSVFKVAKIEEFDEEIHYDHLNVSRTIEPKEPPCVYKNKKYQEHVWESPHSLVGGLKENPGVYGHGGGVVITSVCKNCGCYRTYDTWGQDPCDGSQGHCITTYHPPDEDSLKWIEENEEVEDI